MLHQNAVELTVEINLVSYKLESGFNCIQETLLDDELFDVGDLAAQILDALADPYFSSVSALTGPQWNKNFNLVVELLGRRLKFGLDNGGVKLQETNIS
jgi:hypothetical protein